MKLKLFLIIPVLSLSLASCLNYDFTGKTIKQGNLISEKKLKRLKIGMSKQEVLLVMGSSLVTPLFENDRWDYVQTTKPANQKTKVNSISLYFRGERLSRIKILESDIHH